MPLMTLEYTQNLKGWNPTGLLTKAHQEFASTYGYEIHKIASWAVNLDEYVLGDGRPELALAMLTVLIGQHHSEEEKESMQKWVIGELRTELKPFADSLKVKLGCVLKEAEPSHYTWFVTRTT